MSEFRLGRTSKKRLDTCHKDLVTFVHSAMETIENDLGVVCGVRLRAEQERAFNEGNSNARYGQSPHNPPADLPQDKINEYKSLAVDIAPYKNGGYVWNDKEGDFTTLINHLQSVADKLYDEGAIENRIEQIGSWDMPHWQIRDWKQIQANFEGR